jgi:hypothetical protein
MMKFQDVKIGEVFFENTNGEYYKKLAEDTSVVWELEEDRAYTYRHPLYKDPQTLECDFPPDHPVEYPES